MASDPDLATMLGGLLSCLSSHYAVISDDTERIAWHHRGWTVEVCVGGEWYCL